MFIQIPENYECSECKARNRIEHFSTTTERGIRCLACGHEKREPHPHLTQSSGGTASWSKTRDQVATF